MKLYWMKTSEAWPGDSWHESQFTCFDEEKPDRESDSLLDTSIGNVSQIESGLGGGMCRWSVTVTFPSPRFPRVTNGREISRKEASHCVVECYERMLKFYGRHHSDG